MFDLKHASSNVKKAAYREGIRSGRGNAWFKPVSGESETRVIVGNSRHPDGLGITVYDIEYAAQFTWNEIKSGR